ncbi:MAG: hypothetical protein KGI91_08985 [Burkholderiales bacterium]|nr:hypothetical protein [Burkholderiales bacterium]MDE2077191.1 hypothetical protein [Burkholderiales bacterium]MDE2433177.1 hypothetical protein [Burkholderiales bacterium]
MTDINESSRKLSDIIGACDGACTWSTMLAAESLKNQASGLVQSVEFFKL